MLRRRFGFLLLLVTLAWLLLLPGMAGAGQGPVPGLTPTSSSAGDVTVRAVRLDGGLDLDGVLAEAIYTQVEPVSGFIQIEPEPGAPATDQTDVWVMFDDDNLYVSARCWDSDGNLVATEMRRDNVSLFQGNDIVAFTFDTFHDRRNSFAFIVNPIGGRMDGHQTNENQFNRDWNTIWDVALGRFDGGWTVEVVIPFKSLRYGPGTEQTWGFNVMRPSRTLNEVSFLTEMPPARGQLGIQMASLSATLVGIQAPPSSRLVEMKPYVISNATQDAPADTSALTGDVGLDAKVGLTDGFTADFTADFTVNTDFAQVEADEQQVNLTRFSLSFPEKREFFLENAVTFAFGGVATNGRGPAPDRRPCSFIVDASAWTVERWYPWWPAVASPGASGRTALG